MNRFANDWICPTGPVWEVVIFPNAEETSLRNFGPVVHLLLFREDQKKLAYPEGQGVYFTTNRSGSGLIRYFIEKDLPCIHPRAADALEGASETFAPPPGFVSGIVGDRTTIGYGD